MEDISMTRMFFTWIQKMKNLEMGILKKLGRIMGNCHFVDEFKACFAKFLPLLLSDHSLALLIINDITSKKLWPFRFQNFLAEKEGFLKIVRDNWNVPIKGYAMYVLARRLRLMKKHMRSINRRNGNVFSNVHKLKVEFQRVQMDLNKDPYYSALREEEIIYTNAYKEALLDEERFLRQKSKIEWLKEGDQNNAYFYNYIKGRMSKFRIDSVHDDSGTCFTCTDVAVKFVDHFQGIFGVEGDTYPIDDPIDLFSKKISDSDSLDLVKPVSNDEIKAAVRNYCKQT
ncbi:hypothetical protein Tco_0318560 [Tanacetum coccineum]